MTERAARRPEESPPARVLRRTARERWLIGAEVLTGASALAGGLLLVAAPDGSLLAADPGVLTGSPFVDWRVPGVLLAVLVGVGFSTVAWWQWRCGGWSAALGMGAGLGLMVFEVVQWWLIGFHPLQPVFVAVGAAVFCMAAAELPDRGAAPC